MAAGRGKLHGFSTRQDGRGFQLRIALLPELELGWNLKHLPDPQKCAGRWPCVPSRQLRVCIEPIRSPSPINCLAGRSKEPPTGHTVPLGALASGILSVPGELRQSSSSARPRHTTSSSAAIQSTLRRQRLVTSAHVAAPGPSGSRRPVYQTPMQRKANDAGFAGVGRSTATAHREVWPRVVGPTIPPQCVRATDMARTQHQRVFEFPL